MHATCDSAISLLGIFRLTNMRTDKDKTLLHSVGESQALEKTQMSIKSEMDK